MMEYVKKLNIPVVLLVLITGRMLFTDSTYALAILGWAVAGLYAYKTYLTTKEIKPLDAQVREELAAMKNTISGLAVKNGFKTQSPENQKWF